MRKSRICFAVELLALSVAGCASFSEPTPEVLQAVDHSGKPAPYVRETSRVSVTSAWLSGKYTGAMVARSGDPAVRLQCFPDVGGKALDMLARPTRIVGVLPQLGQGCDVALPTSERPNPITLMGVALLELNAAVTRDRVLGARAEDGGWALLLRPVVEGVRVVAWIDSVGRVRRRQLEWNGARWDEEIAADGTYVCRGRGSELRVEQRQMKAVESVPPALFELTLPEGTGPLRP